MDVASQCVQKSVKFSKHGQEPDSGLFVSFILFKHHIPLCNVRVRSKIRDYSKCTYASWEQPVKPEVHFFRQNRYAIAKL